MVRGHEIRAGAGLRIPRHTPTRGRGLVPPRRMTWNSGREVTQRQQEAGNYTMSARVFADAPGTSAGHLSTLYRSLENVMCLDQIMTAINLCKQPLCIDRRC